MEQNEKSALLEKAKKDYPIGTKFRNMDKPKFENTIANHDFSFYDINNEILCVCIEEEWNVGAEQSDPAIYQNGKWAEIISKPTQGEFIGYVVPFDMWGGSVAKNDIYYQTNQFSKIYACKTYPNDGGYYLPAEIVETWEKAYKQVETAPDKFQQVIELIEKQIDNIQVCINQSIENEDLMDKAYYSTSFRDFNKLLDKIKQL